jgi:transposase
VEEVVADKGYHSGPVLKSVHAQGAVTFPSRSADDGTGKATAKLSSRSGQYQNRGECREIAGSAFRRSAVNLTERSFAHMYETGGMRRVHRRGRDNILRGCCCTTRPSGFP